MRPPNTPTLARVAALACGLLIFACGANEPETPFAPTDPAGKLFAPDHIIEVAIEIDPQDWDTLRNQTRTWWDAVARENKQCLSQPFPKPWTYFPATVTVDGMRRENVGIHKKGFLGSIDVDRPALKVRFDHYLPDQRLLGLSRLTLNNSKQDPSYLRQCLSYEVFGAAGVPVPWCNFAHLTVNGKDFGLYVNVESMDRHFVRRHFEADQGDLWEGEYSDFRPEWLNTFEKKGDVEDDDQTRVDRSSLREVSESVASAVQDVGLIERLSRHIDLEEFLTLWATEKILEHWDGYANNTSNFLIYHDPATHKFVFIPTGTDQITVVDPFSQLKPPVSVYATGVLSNRLYSALETRPLYVARLRQVLDQAWNEPQLLAEIDRMRALVWPVLVAAGADLKAVEQGIQDLRAFVSSRRGVILGDIQNGARAWSQPLRDPSCVDRSGDAQGSFDTTYGTSGRDAFASGRATLAVNYRRQAQVFRRVGATSGVDQDDPQNHWPVIDLSAEGVNGNWYSAWISVRPDLFRSGGVAKLDGVEASGGMGYWNPATRQWVFMGSFMNGELRLSQAQAEDGRPVSGTFDAWLILWD
jgi:hypothetical protein